MTAALPESGTIRHLIAHYAPSVLEDVQNPPSWPPDAFALVAAVLHLSGGYRRVLDDWPPRAAGLWPPGPPPPGDTREWQERIRAIGEAWRGAALATGTAPPEVVHWWKFVMNAQGGSCRLAELRYDRDLSAAENNSSRDVSHALIMILAAADEASVGAGTPSLLQPALTQKKRRGLEADTFDARVDNYLLDCALQKKPSSLCSPLVDSAAIQVLPKQHTPQSGLTIRSMSHNLALRIGDEIHPEWVSTVRPVATDRPETYYLNLLLVPWPQTIGPAQFTEARVPKGVDPCFDFEIASMKRNREAFHRLFSNAAEMVEHIDGVIFPEAAFPEDEHLDFYSSIAEEAWQRSTFMVAGMGKRATRDADGENYVSYICPVGDSLHIHEIVQHKLHRWRLDEPQIRQYGIGSRLNPRTKWWENISLRYRKLHFFSIRPWLTMSVLICEDLARQDSVSDLLRAVGPNLVIAVLMDGPQLATRWPARYATVLADDPGSSVLTLTSVGMAKLSRPHDKPPSRVVALWKDARTPSPIALELADSDDALILSLTYEPGREYTADGRDDGNTSSYIRLSGVHPVSLERRKGGHR